MTIQIPFSPNIRFSLAIQVGCFNKQAQQIKKQDPTGLVKRQIVEPIFFLLSTPILITVAAHLRAALN